MRFLIDRDDPFNVLSSTKSIVESLQYVKIDEENINTVSKVIAKKLQRGIDSAEMHFGTTGNLEKDIQLIFLEDTVNFCFWAEKDKQKWEVGYPIGSVSEGGWYSLTKCFQRALDQKEDILNPDYLIDLNLEKTSHLFRGVTDVEIPLLKERLSNLKEAGLVLKKKYNGQFVNALEEADFDAIKIVKILYKNFPSFRDVSIWNKNKIHFLKRAQICAQDFSYLNQKHKEINIKKINSLTAFADYKIPQMLRKYRVISYTKDLADKIDNYVLIPKDSREEIEIRSSVIWCIELIRQKLGRCTAADIDNALWLLSQNHANIKPYHRTYSTYY